MYMYFHALSLTGLWELPSLTYLLSDFTGWSNWLVKTLRVGHSIVDTQQGLYVWITNEALKKVYVLIPSELFRSQTLQSLGEFREDFCLYMTEEVWGTVGWDKEGRDRGGSGEGMVWEGGTRG